LPVFARVSSGCFVAQPETKTFPLRQSPVSGLARYTSTWANYFLQARFKTAIQIPVTSSLFFFAPQQCGDDGFSNQMKPCGIAIFMFRSLLKRATGYAKDTGWKRIASVTP
jgi:hypothetical protein